jgi:hypothetical protein
LHKAKEMFEADQTKQVVDLHIFNRKNLLRGGRMGVSCVIIHQDEVRKEQFFRNFSEVFSGSSKPKSPKPA